jgi:hypothetical protein
MHGIGALPGAADHTFNVFFSASGLPPHSADRSGNWPHDVYLARWHADTGKLETPRIFIRKPEAQEPVTVARNYAAQVMVSFEDGWNAPENVTQRFGIDNTALRPIKPHPQLVESGGHSGHMQLRAEPDVLTLSGTLLNTDGNRVKWHPVGSVGLLRTSGSLDWLSLTEKGLEPLRFNPEKAQPANAVDQCGQGFSPRGPADAGARGHPNGRAPLRQCAHAP